MRITNIYLANNMIYNIQQNMSRLAHTDEQMATGSRMLRPSDDPVQLGELLKIKAALSYREQYALNIDDGLSYMDVTDSSMITLNSVLTLAWKYTIQAAHDTYDPEDRKAVAQQIDKMIDQVVDLANSTVGGRYVYGGTKNDVAPFERIGDKIIFKGNTAEVRREVAAATNYRIDAPGMNTGFKIDMKGTLEPPKIISRQIDENASSGLKIEVIGDDGDKATAIRVFYGPDEENDYIDINDTPGGMLENGILKLDNSIPNKADLEGLTIDLTGCLNQAEYTFEIDNTVGVFGNGEWQGDEYVIYDANANPPKKYYLPGDPNESFGNIEYVDDANYSELLNRDWGLFDSLFSLRDNLLDNNTQGLQINIQQLKNDIDNVLRHQVAEGARYNHFDALKTMLLDQEVKLTNSMKNIEGADMARLSIDFNQQLLTYNASLAIGANIMNTSLLNYLK